MYRIVLRLSAVKSRTGISRSSIYSGIKNGTFPQPISLGPRAVGWLESSIEQWIQECVEQTSKRGGQ